MSKGPPPRLDLSKRGLEEFKDDSSAISLSEDEDVVDNGASSSPVKRSNIDDEDTGVSMGSERRKKKPNRPSAKTLSGSPSTSFMKPRDTQTLILSNNKLTKLPSEFPLRFEELRALFLDHNQFTEFPVAVCQLPHLEKLHVEFNAITRLPAEVKNWKYSLKKLYINNNKLTDLPEELGELSGLQVLDIRNNQIKALPFQLAGSTQLQEISVQNNPIASPPPFVYNKGIVHLLRYMREVREAMLQDTPLPEYIFTRKIAFTEAKKGLKRAPSKVLTRAQSQIVDQKDSKAINAHMKKGSGFFREQVEDSVLLDQNHLLYYLTDYHAHETCGRRDYMEDRCICLPRLKQKQPTALLEEVVNMFSKVGFFGVFDGHGGDKCADFLIQHLHKNICNQPAFAAGDFEKAIRIGFRNTDEAFLQRCREYNLIDGSTCLVALFVDNQLITAHAGDSRAVLCRDKKAIRLTEDHKPDRVDELARIEELGGEVLFRGNCFRVSGDLAMSRSFGDLRLKEPKHLVVSDPEIRVETLTPKDEFVILASDGLWDVLSDQRAVDIARKCATVEEASKKLVETALALGTMDNTTVIVVKLDWCIDFITQDEIEGNTDPAKAKAKKEEEDKEDKTRTLNSTASFRNSLEKFETESAPLPKGLYPQASQAAIKLKVLIPSLEATKLMKFDTNIAVKEIKKAIMLKHRFTEPPEAFQIYKSESNDAETLLDGDSTLNQCNIKDMDVIEIRSIGTPSRRGSVVEGVPFAFSEALPGVTDAQLLLLSQQDKEAQFNHRVTSMWSPEDKYSNINNNNFSALSSSPPKQESWKPGLVPESPRREGQRKQSSSDLFTMDDKTASSPESSPNPDKKQKKEKKKKKPKDLDPQIFELSNTEDEKKDNEPSTETEQPQEKETTESTSTLETSSATSQNETKDATTSDTNTSQTPPDTEL